MSEKDPEVKPIPLESIPAYEGPHAIPGIRFRAARSALGVSAWGMNVLEIAPHNQGHPQHDHIGDGQEEVYFVVQGEAELHLGTEAVQLRAGDFVRVPPDLPRKLVTKDAGVTVLAMGATPGEVFKPSM